MHEYSSSIETIGERCFTGVWFFVNASFHLAALVMYFNQQ